MGTFLHFLATGCYTGYLPGAPGTWATVLIGIPLCVALKYLGEVGFTISLVVFLILSVWCSDFVERNLEEKDPPFVVIDEISGFLASMLFLPVSARHLVLACALFRLFDIVKIYPIRYIEKRLPGGWGITLDDVAAGLLANVLVHALDLLV